MDALGQFIYKRTYARFIPEEGRRETWPETVDRYCNWLFHNPAIPEKVKKKSRQKILDQQVLGSMRATWTAGPAADLDNATIYNCAYLNVEDIGAFGECLYLLMCGTGVGFSVENKHISKLPKVEHQKNLSTYTHIVDDSRMGWKIALDKGLEAWWHGRDITFDFSCLRPMGAPLRTMGGRSSGGEVLRQLLSYARELILGCQGRQVSSLEAHSLMCQVAAIVIVGGTRRSALISLSDLEDQDIRNCKRGAFHPRLYGANNSATYYQKPDMLTFLDEWVALAKSGSGERGISNLWAARKNAPTRRKGKLIEGMNPCLRGDMRLLTVDGYQRFDELADTSGDAFGVSIINKEGTKTEGLVWCSGKKDCVELSFRSKDYANIVCTPDHKFMLNDGTVCLAKDTKEKRLMPFFSIKEHFDLEKFLAGYIQGDGSTGRLSQDNHKGMEVDFGVRDNDIADMYNQETGTWRSTHAYSLAEKYCLSSQPLPDRALPENDIIYDPDFWAGLFSANGSVAVRTNGNGHVMLGSSCRKLIDRAQEVLKNKFNIHSTVTNRKPQTCKWNNGTYTSKPISVLTISKHKSIVGFANQISFGQKYKQHKLKELIINMAPQVRVVKAAGIHPVYDFNEPITNWGVVNNLVASNCGEVTLRNREFCNLTEVIVRPDDDFESLRDKVTTAAWLGTIQSTFDYFPALHQDWHDNAVDERLVGISLSGQMDNPDLLSSEVLKLLRQHATNTCRKAAKTLNINMPASCTTVKPAGTTSQVVNSSAGIHPRYAPYYIRNVMIATNDPLFAMMRDQGAPIFYPKSNGESTAVIQFPVASPKNAITRHDMSALQQLDWYLKNVTNWTDMNASATIYVDKDEWLSVANWVYDHFDRVNGLTFFPKMEDDNLYEWTPFQEVGQGEYEALAEKFPEIDYNQLATYETYDQGDGAKELACAGGACII